MTLYDKRRIKTEKQALERIDELHRTVIRPIDLLGIVPQGSVLTARDTARQDQALAEIRELTRVFNLQRRPK